MVSYSLMVSIYKGKIKNNSKGLNNKYFFDCFKVPFYEIKGPTVPYFLHLENLNTMKLIKIYSRKLDFLTVSIKKQHQLTVREYLPPKAPRHLFHFLHS
jgi:hypothetical protein